MLSMSMRWESLETMSLKIFLLEHPHLLPEFDVKKLSQRWTKPREDLTLASFDDNFLGSLAVSCIPDKIVIKDIKVLPVWNYHKKHLEITLNPSLLDVAMSSPKNGWLLPTKSASRCPKVPSMFYPLRKASEVCNLSSSGHRRFLTWGRQQAR